MITAERLRELLTYNPETGIFTWNVTVGGRIAGSIAGRINGTGYWYIGIDGRIYRAHRLAWFYESGEWPIKMVDHINGVRTDNRFGNLRLATPSQNQCNSKKQVNNTSGFKGVHWNVQNERWQAYIRFGGKRKHLGYFDTIDEAKAAYRTAAELIHGEFARVE